jgi:hypothetical protein
MTGRRLGALTALVALVAPLAGCGSATPDASAYREQVRLAAGTAVSQVATVGKLLAADRDGKVLGGYGTTVLRSSGDSLDGVRSDLGAVLPPPGQDRTAARAARLLDRAARQLSAAAVALHRDDLASYPHLIDALGRTGAALEQLEGDLR